MIPFVVMALLLVPCAVLAEPQDPISGRKEAYAIRVPSDAIDLDGRLDEAVWRTAPPIADFVQKEPLEGARPTDRMEVRFAYDDSGLYVGARMYSDAPIQAPMGRRDSGEQAEHLLVSLDTYFDRRTASTFGVTASGVRIDHYYPSDSRSDDDASFDPVWQARTTIDGQGWTAELWIPFSQLRFTDRSPQIWGLNVQRWVPSRNEEVYWALVPRTEHRWASLFGDLRGLENVRPRRRVELLPYAGSSSKVLGNRDPGDPFSSDIEGDSHVGLDAKIGIGSNLTLEATINPDFGQVEADPAEVNLSAFETFFDERRPFFVEGSELLTGNVANYFYSRRIGAAPAAPATGDFVKYPATSTILGAAKLTGRLQSGLSVAMLGAVTGEEFARTFAADQFGRVGVAPRTMYGVARLQQEFGAAGSTTALMATSVHRDMADGDPLASLLARNAFTVSSDSLFRFRGGDYELMLNGGVTSVNGEAAAIDLVQRASTHYLHRPDATYLRYDSNRTSLTGLKLFANLDRRNGRHWVWEFGTDIETPGMDTNDIGRMNSADGIVAQGELEYRETVPGRWWREYSLGASTRNEWNFGGDLQYAHIDPAFRVTWLNFWQTELSGVVNAAAQDQRLTRGGPSMGHPGGWEVGLEVDSPNAAQTRGDVSLEYGGDEDGGLTFDFNVGLTVQPGSQWQLSIRPEYERLHETQQYLATVAGGSAATYGQRYVFANIDRSTYSTSIRLNYTFKPDLTLDVYGEPFAASGSYHQIGELAAARTRARRLYGTDGTILAALSDGSHRVTDGETTFTLKNHDFNVQSFRSNVVLRWEWRAGSTLYFVWQQDKSSEIFSPTRVSLGDMFGSIGRRGDNFFAIKATYWFSPR